jgi:hypothetical protein
MKLNWKALLATLIVFLVACTSACTPMPVTISLPTAGPIVAPTPADTSTLTPSATWTLIPSATPSLTPSVTPSVPSSFTPSLMPTWLANSACLLVPLEARRIWNEASSRGVISHAGVYGVLIEEVPESITLQTAAGTAFTFPLTDQTRIEQRNSTDEKDIFFTKLDKTRLGQAARQHSSATIFFSCPSATTWSTDRVLLDVGSIVSTRTPTLPPPTVTPVLSTRLVDLPWGKVNLDLPAEESNSYAMAWWCHWEMPRVKAADLNMWFTNPKGMLIGRAPLPYVLNVEILSKDSNWQIDDGSARFFRAVGLVRATPDKSDTYRLNLVVYEHAPLDTNIPFDGRMYDQLTLAPIPGPGITDVNQIRVGQIYGFSFFERDGRWPRAVEQINTLSARSGGDEGNQEIVIYTAPVKWEATCDHFKQTGAIK